MDRIMMYALDCLPPNSLADNCGGLETPRADSFVIERDGRRHTTLVGRLQLARTLLFITQIQRFEPLLRLCFIILVVRQCLATRDPIPPLTLVSLVINFFDAFLVVVDFVLTQQSSCVLGVCRFEKCSAWKSESEAGVVVISLGSV